MKRIKSDSEIAQKKSEEDENEEGHGIKYKHCGIAEQ